MTMIDYRCPLCRKKAFGAGGVLQAEIAWKCTRSSCDYIGSPQPDLGPVFQRTCGCTQCGRTRIIDCPVDDSMVCLVCGTTTLVVTDEVRPPVGEPIPEAQEPVRARRQQR